MLKCFNLFHEEAENTRPSSNGTLHRKRYSVQTQTRPRTQPNNKNGNKPPVKTEQSVRQSLVDQGATPEQVDQMIGSVDGEWKHVPCGVALARRLVRFFGDNEVALRLVQNQLIGGLETGDTLRVLSDYAKLLEWRYPSSVEDGPSAKGIIHVALDALDTKLVKTKPRASKPKS